MGNLGSAHAVAEVIHELIPRHVILVGICGALVGSTSDYQLGDVVVSDIVVHYEPAKIVGDVTQWRSVTYKNNVESILAAAKCLEGGTWTAENSIGTAWPGGGTRHRPDLKFGVVCSGEKVVASTEYAATLQKLEQDAISVDMEAAGVAYACDKSETGFLVVKSVVDYADESKNDCYREYAAATAASFVRSLLTESPLPRAEPRTSGKPPIEDCLQLVDGSTAIVLPSYENTRHRKPIDPMVDVKNYPMNPWESAYDDVYCALRIVAALEPALPAGMISLVFDQDPQPKIQNRILIGSSISNCHTKSALRSLDSYYRFGGEDAHAIVDHFGEEKFQAVTEPVVDNQRVLVTDYALLSSFAAVNERVVILAGVRAYAQVFLGDYLTNIESVDALMRLLPDSADYQCVVEVNVLGFDYNFERIASIAVREKGTAQWKITDTPSARR